MSDGVLLQATLDAEDTRESIVWCEKVAIEGIGMISTPDRA